MTREAPLEVGGLLYPGFEMLDLFGPLEMFSLLGPEQVAITTVAAQAAPTSAAVGSGPPCGPKVLADFDFATAPRLDVLIIPGGFGTFPALEDAGLLDYLRRCATAGTVLASVCTGSAILAKAGVLDGRRATSNKQFFDLARRQGAKVNWIEAARWVDEGQFLTSSGVSAGMDMALALIARFFDEATAASISVSAEYTRHIDADTDPFIAYLNEGMAAL
ncbi:MAG: DJ-1/PfpI family protein [Gammaproteobacteria bacterium]|nr:DJ-1/PfpI family protein [Gammaproteobacteria bacterium]